MSDGRPTVHCIIAWWPVKSATPIVRPRGLDTVDSQGKRHVMGAAVPLHEAVGYADAGFEVMTDPFDMEDLIRQEQIDRSKR